MLTLPPSISMHAVIRYRQRSGCGKDEADVRRILLHLWRAGKTITPSWTRNRFKTEFRESKGWVLVRLEGGNEIVTVYHAPTEDGEALTRDLPATPSPRR